MVVPNPDNKFAPCYHASRTTIKTTYVSHITITLGIMLLLSAGSTSSLGVFVVPVEKNAVPSHSLQGVWQAAMGSLTFLAAPIMVCTGIFLDGVSADPCKIDKTSFLGSKTMRARVLAFIAALGSAALSLSGIGVLRNSAGIITFGVASQCLTLGIGYVLGMELLVGCFSERPGLAVGIGEVGYGLGHILGAPMMQMLLRSFRTVTGIYMSAMLFVACNMLPAVLTRWPIPAEREGSGENSGHERAALIEDIAHKVDEEQSLRVMMRQRTFWLFAIVVATSGASYGFFPYFFKLGSIFGQPSHLVTTYFQVIGSVSIAACLLSCAVMDYAKIGTGFWGMGSKNVMMFFLALQAMCFWLLIRFSESGHYFGFVCTLLVLSISAVTLTGSSVVLARDLFGNTNGCIVFGVAGGLGLGLGEASSAWLMTASERMASHVGGSESPIDFITFYAIGLIWSLVGLFCLIMTRKQALVPGILV